MPQDAALGLSPRRRGSIDVEAYVAARASGETQAGALRAAGSLVRSPTAASRTAGRIEARPSVRAALAEARATVKATSDRAWRMAIAWAEGVFLDPAATNFDRLGAATFLGRVRAAFTERVEIARSYRVEIRGFLSDSPRVIAIEPPPAADLPG